jgi:predicted outer membrane repeat protein
MRLAPHARLALSSALPGAPPPRAARPWAALMWAALLCAALLCAACSGGGGTDGDTGGGGHVPGRIHVSATAAPDGDGASWVSAYDDLQKALDVARAGDEIWVRAGVYRPDRAGDRARPFALVSGVAIYGGFAGGESSPAQRDLANHTSVLSGDLAGDDTSLGGASTLENSYQVVVALDCGPGTRLDGFTIRGGRADGPGFGATPASLDQGAGINVYDGVPVFANLVLERNWNANHGAANDHGHAATWIACTFRDNHSAGHGAGLYVHHHSQTLAVDCTFEDNVATTDGAGSYSRSHMGARYERCTFARNRAQRGAGLYCAAEAAPELVECLFEDNQAELGGGGIYADLASPWIEGSLFRRNAAGLGVVGGGAGGGGSGGGGVWSEGGEPVVLDCYFEQNAASFGAGVYCIFESRAHVVDCSFVHNQAAEAGGVYSLAAPITVEGCEFLENRAAGGEFSVGGGMSTYFGDALVTDSLFRGNSAELGGGALYMEGARPGAAHCRFEANRVDDDSVIGGGAILNSYFAVARVEGCTLVGNRAPRGGGVYELAFADTLVVNCTLAGNQASLAGGNVFGAILNQASWWNCILSGGAPDELAGTPIELHHVLVPGGAAGENVLAGSALFVRAPTPGADGAWGSADDDFGDLRLAPGSLGIDAGRNRAVRYEPPVDLSGAARFVDDPLVPDTGLPAGGPVVDLGAYERQP